MKAKVSPLTGIRGVAAGWVVLLHLQLLLALPRVPVLTALVSGGNIGVDLFFMLSGFIIAYTYLDRLSAPRADGAVREYLLLRVARVYPVHLVMLLVMAALVAALTIAGSAPADGRRFTALSFVMNLLMLQAVPPALAWNDPAWSISTEFAAYLVFPLLVPLLLRLRTRGALIGMAVLVVAGMTGLWILLAGADSWAYWSGYVLMWARIAICFPAGCLLYVLWRSRPAEHWRRWAAPALLVAAAGIVASCFAAPSAGDVTLPVLAYPFLLLLLFGLATAPPSAARLLGSRAMVWAGKVSYSVYLVHFPLILVVRAAAQRLGLLEGPTGTALTVGFALVATVVAGGALYHFVEEPARRLIRRWAARSATPRPDDRTPSRP